MVGEAPAPGPWLRGAGWLQVDHHWAVVARVQPVLLRALQPALSNHVLREEDIVDAAGGQILGHYHGIRGGHAMNNAILHALFADPANYRMAIYQYGTQAPAANPLVVTDQIPAARLFVDMWHTLYTLNYAMTTDGAGNPAGPAASGTGPAGRTVPSISAGRWDRYYRSTWYRHRCWCSVSYR